MLKLSVALAVLACAWDGAAAAREGLTIDDSLRPEQLHTLARHLPNVAYYPEFARIKHLEGRVLLEFHIDAQGNTEGAHVIQSDANPILTATALRVVQRLHYELGAVSVDPQTRFRTSVIYCLAHCASAAQYPGSDAVIEITGSALPGHMVSSPAATARR